MAKSKTDIRKEKLNIRKNISDYEMSELNKKIFNRILEFEDLLFYDDFLIYSSYNNEVDTVPIANYLWGNKKEIYYPKVLGDDMEFYCVGDFEALSLGCKGILEPLGNPCDQYYENENTLMLLPLLAFDRNGNRIGYGGGFYDKYLSNHKIDLKIGLAYSFQESNEIVSDVNDVKLDYIITDKEIIEVK